MASPSLNSTGGSLYQLSVTAMTSHLYPLLGDYSTNSLQHTALQHTALQHTGPSPLQRLMASPIPFTQEAAPKHLKHGAEDELLGPLPKKQRKVMNLQEYMAWKSGKPYITTTSQSQTSQDTEVSNSDDTAEEVSLILVILMGVLLT